MDPTLTQRWNYSTLHLLPVQTDTTNTTHQRSVKIVELAAQIIFSSQEIFLKDHRQWTSVRDNQLESMSKAQIASKINIINNEVRFTSLQNENCAITDDIVNLDEEDTGLDNADIIEEADRLLDQLDLLSSSGDS